MVNNGIIFQKMTKKYSQYNHSLIVVKFFDLKKLQNFCDREVHKISKFFEYPFLIQNRVKFCKKIFNLYLRKIINLKKLLY